MKLLIVLILSMFSLSIIIKAAPSLFVIGPIVIGFILVVGGVIVLLTSKDKKQP